MVHVIGSGDSAVIEFAKKCSAAGGVPIFQTKYGGKPLDETIGRRHNLSPHVVLAKCWGAGKTVKGGIIQGVSESIYRKIETEKGEWKEFVKMV